MARQWHDLGRRKRAQGQQPMSKARLQFERIKRRHPGPLPPVLRSFKDWLEAGKPTRFR